MPRNQSHFACTFELCQSVGISQCCEYACCIRFNYTFRGTEALPQMLGLFLYTSYSVLVANETRYRRSLPCQYLKPQW